MIGLSPVFAPVSPGTLVFFLDNLCYFPGCPCELVREFALPDVEIGHCRRFPNKIQGKKEQSIMHVHLKNALFVFAVALVAIWASNRFQSIKNITG